MSQKIEDAFKSDNDYTIFAAANQNDALNICSASHIDIILSDICLPDADGFTLCDKIRRYSELPIIIVSDKSSEEYRIQGFELGIDDYITKPFNQRELKLRTEAVLKRTKLYKPDTGIKKSTYKIGGLTANLSSREITAYGSSIILSPKEYELLTFMMKNKGAVLTRKSIIEAVWENKIDESSRTLDTHIKSLRKSLGPCGNMITTLRGVGYKFDVS